MRAAVWVLLGLAVLIFFLAAQGLSWPILIVATLVVCTITALAVDRLI